MAAAVLALALKVLIPPGFMMAPTPGTAPTLVICTGHGALEGDALTPLRDAAGKKAPADKSSHDAPCVFAGHGVAAPAPETAPTEVAFLAPAAAPALPSPVGELIPGRGLAAPPPPSRGPPPALT
jgi:hypothetical protein